MKIDLAVYLTVLLVGSMPCATANAAAAKKPQQKPKTQQTGKPSGGSWDSGLSNMMDQIEGQLGPGKSKTKSGPTGEDVQPSDFPPETLPTDKDSTPANSPSVGPPSPDTVPSSAAPGITGSGASELPPEPLSEDETAALKGKATAAGSAKPANSTTPAASAVAPGSAITPGSAAPASSTTSSSTTPANSTPSKPIPWFQLAMPEPADSAPSNAVQPGPAQPSSAQPSAAQPNATNALAPGAPEENYFSELEKSGLTRWEKSRIPVKIFIEQTSNARGFRPEFAAILAQAFKDWGSEIPAVKIEFVDSAVYSQVSCTWTDNKADLMSSLEGGNTVVVPDDLGILHADVKVYTLPPKEFPTIPAHFMRRVALHEAGHALGLTAHSEEKDDIMYGIVYPKDDPCSLTTRDKNTLISLYAKTSIASQRLDATRAALSGDQKNPKVRALQLNNEAADAMKQQKLDVAERKLAEAHKLDPTNKIVSGNLGAMYANIGALAGMAFNFPIAITNFKQAIPLLEAGGNRTALVQVLTNYATILRTANNAIELKRIEAKLKSLSP